MTPEQIARACVQHMLGNDAASRAMNIEIVDVSPGHATIRMSVTQSMTNGFDICHGGVLFTFGDSALAFAANTYNDLAVLAGASIDLLRSVSVGAVLTAEAVEQNRGARTALYDVTIADDAARTIAVMRGRVMRMGRPVLTDSQG